MTIKTPTGETITVTADRPWVWGTWHFTGHESVVWEPCSNRPQTHVLYRVDAPQHFSGIGV